MSAPPQALSRQKAKEELQAARTNVSTLAAQLSEAQSLVPLAEEKVAGHMSGCSCHVKFSTRPLAPHKVAEARQAYEKAAGVSPALWCRV